MNTRICERFHYTAENNRYVCKLCLTAHERFIHKRIFEMNSNGKVFSIAIYCKECHGKVYSQETEIFIPQYGYPTVVLESKFRPWKRD